MKRISTATAVQNRFVDGNKSTGQKATQFSAEWCNQVQEEIAGLLEGNGITLGNSENQLFDLFSKIFSVGFDAIEIGDLTSRVVIGPGYIRQLRSGLSGIAISEGELKIVSLDGTETIAKLSYSNGTFALDHGLAVTGNIGASGKVVSRGKEVNSYGDTVPSGGSYFKLTDSEITLASAPGQFGRAVFLVSLNNAQTAYNVTGIGILEASKVSAPDHDVGTDWRIGVNGGLAFKKVSGSSEFTVARFVGNDFEMLDGYIRGKNTILASSNVDLTSSAYSSIAAGTELTVVNNGSTTISVTFASGATAENIDASSARKYVKKTSGFARLIALDPTATLP